MKYIPNWKRCSYTTFSIIENNNLNFIILIICIYHELLVGFKNNN